MSMLAELIRKEIKRDYNVKVDLRLEEGSGQELIFRYFS